MANANNLPDAIFRAYDIRGIAHEQLDGDAVELIAQAIGSEAVGEGITTLLVARDGRLSSAELSERLVKGLLASGVDVVDLGMVPTPLLYFATFTTQFGSGVMLTASHNPANYNGLKVVFRQHCLADNQIQDIKLRANKRNFTRGHGRYSQESVSENYFETITSQVSLARPLKVVLDCGNAVPGQVAPTLFNKLDCDVVPLYCEVDGNFPAHHPDPTVPANLVDLQRAVREHQADIGFCFDGDGDRLGVVDEAGNIQDADAILQLLAEDIVPRYPDKVVVFDVKCSNRLARLVSDLGGRPRMHRSGHSFMKQAMLNHGAPLGGEYAAHFFIKDRWFGYDDGMYAAARLAEILSRHEQAASEVFGRFSGSVSTPEIFIPVAEAEKFDVMARIQTLADFSDAKVLTIDGMRAEFDNGWGLVRASNTVPALILRFEADDADSLKTIMSEFKALICKADNSLELDNLIYRGQGQDQLSLITP